MRKLWKYKSTAKPAGTWWCYIFRQIHAEVALKRIDSFLSAEDLEEYVQLIDPGVKSEYSGDEDDDDDDGIDTAVTNAIEIFNASFKWSSAQVVPVKTA